MHEQFGEDWTCTYTCAVLADRHTNRHTNEQIQTSQYSAPLFGRRKTRSLHWLPGQQRIDYKVALLTFKVRSTSTPAYPRRLIQNRQHSHNLRSATTALCQPSKTTTLLLPAVWNSLPKLSLIVTLFSVTVFSKSRLKIFLFSLAFSLLSSH